jgi:hypothetical protein
MEALPRGLIAAGLTLVVAGVVLHYFGGFGWLGRLPGDIRIERPGFRFYFPVTTGILLSLVISFIVWIVSRGR